jgi:hypothetical protein
VISVVAGSNFVDVVGEFLLVVAADLLTWLSAHPRRSLVEAGRPGVGVRPLLAVRIR